MKHLRLLVLGHICVALLSLPALGADSPTRVLLITGGHDYQTNQFVKMFQANPDITLLTAQHPKAHEWFRSENAGRYDVIVLYDMWQEISAEAKADFVARLKEGKGLVSLHHSLGSYQKWPEFADIVGGKYHLEKYTVNGVEKPGSTYQHDVVFKVQVAAPDHPVTSGVKDFEIHDETYGGFEVKPGVTPLLTTAEPTSTPTIAWAKDYANARVVYLQLGHDHLAYENPSFARLVRQAIRWVAAQRPAPAGNLRVRGEE